MTASSVPKPRRLPPAMYRALLTTHIVVTGIWLGLAAAKLFLVVYAMTSPAGLAGPLVTAAAMVIVAFPPLAIATTGTGVVLSLGTNWGLVQHTWVLVKLGLAVGVVVSGIRFAERFGAPSIAAAIAPGSGNEAAAAITALATPLIVLGVIHALMLGAATVISVYKPWGKTWFGLRGAAARSREAQPAAHEVA